MLSTQLSNERFKYERFEDGIDSVSLYNYCTAVAKFLAGPFLDRIWACSAKIQKAN